MLKYRIIHKEVVCDGLDKNDAHNVLLQMQSQESKILEIEEYKVTSCLLYTSPSPRD